MKKPTYLSERPNIRQTGSYSWPELSQWPPTFDELHEYATGLRCSDDNLRAFIEHWTAHGWVDRKGHQKHDAKLLLRHYLRAQRRNGAPDNRDYVSH